VRWQGLLLAEEPAATPFAPRRLAERTAALLEQQRRDWPLLADGYAALARAETKLLRVAAAEVWVQHNPARIRSTTAVVDPAAVARRGCFLCPEGLPAEEKGIPVGQDLVALCNPFPVLDRHISLVHRDHVPQAIVGWEGRLVGLAQEMGPADFVLYNGPRCGASAPDHLHFQACSRSLLPIEASAAGLVFRPAEPAHGDVEWAVLGPRQCGRTVILLRATQLESAAGALARLLRALPRESGEAEPRVNVVGVHDGRAFLVYVFPRTRHRPACFSAEGDERMLVSPGGIDMAGVVVAPERRDYARIDGPRLEARYAEVTAEAEAVETVTARTFR